MTLNEAVVRLRRALPDRAACHLDQALAGDAEAAEELIFAAPNALRPDCAWVMYRRGIADDAYRATLASVWDHDHHYMRDRIAPWLLRPMFRAARFPTDHLPETLCVWRGTSGLPRQSRTGLSWTTNRDCACWFATTWMRAGKQPSVWTTTLPRWAVLMHHRERGEDEIVAFAAKRVTLDGTVEDWREVGQRYEAAKEAQRAAELHAMREADAIGAP